MDKIKIQSTAYPDSPASNYAAWCKWMIARNKQEWKKRININKLEMEIVYLDYEGLELGIDYSMDIEIEAAVVFVDHGIGEYEFWGTKGYHTDMRPEVDMLHITNSTVYDEDLKEVEETEEIQKLVERWLSENSQKIDEDILDKLDS